MVFKHMVYNVLTNYFTNYFTDYFTDYFIIFKKWVGVYRYNVTVFATKKNAPASKRTHGFNTYICNNIVKEKRFMVVCSSCKEVRKKN